tara:strand:- start:1221 stop:1880 length:660 start_codon:yes stop_codon:yes gene_type:complete
MKVLELFAGSRSFSKVAEELGMKTYTTDLIKFDKIDNVCDIMDIDEYDIINGLDGIPDIIWASPPCTTFSVASLGHHWTGGKGAYIPKTDKCKQNIKVVKKTIELIKYFKKHPLFGNAGLKYYIENPRGVLRKLPIMDWTEYRRTVWYCQYGDNRAKPTDIWTNDFNWIPRPVCKNGNRNCHHEPAPRGSRTGTQGLKGNYERSIVPPQLCREILENIK